ncbi:MAG: maleylpyruvate isomerase family mycothiol-dependent enzyme [Deltaproteobacteria bacterium]|nr:maleylpyruvate isomerase family mycothiol-dependent enzyme [Deltaproteobacteria bacterium]
MSLFDAIADERRGLAELADTLTEEQLGTPSLVPTWTVRDVIAHLTLGMEVSTLRFAMTLLLARGSFEKAADRLTWWMARRPVRELADILRRKAEHRFTPPGMGPEAPLSETLVHGLDLRRPLAIRRAIPEERARICLDFLARTPARGFVRSEWREGLRFEATDLSWAHGEGPLLRGPSDSLLLALTGRRQALSELEGDGVDLLRERYQPA